MYTINTYTYTYMYVNNIHTTHIFTHKLTTLHTMRISRFAHLFLGIGPEARLDGRVLSRSGNTVILVFICLAVLDHGVTKALPKRRRPLLQGRQCRPALWRRGRDGGAWGALGGPWANGRCGDRRSQFDGVAAPWRGNFTRSSISTSTGTGGGGRSHQTDQIGVSFGLIQMRLQGRQTDRKWSAHVVEGHGCPMTTGGS